MADTESNSVEIGTRAPDFTLKNTVSGADASLSELKGEKGTVIMFICNHCPFVKHVNAKIVNLAEEYQDKGFGFIAISSNDVENYPQDHPDLMRENAKEQNYPFPYLYDSTQEVAKNYDAACTPDFYIFDRDLKLFYHGQLDDSRPNNGIPVTGKDLQGALDAIDRGEQPPQPQKPSLGCGIKWK